MWGEMQWEDGALPVIRRGKLSYGVFLKSIQPFHNPRLCVGVYFGR